MTCDICKGRVLRSKLECGFLLHCDLIDKGATKPHQTKSLRELDIKKKGIF